MAFSAVEGKEFFKEWLGFMTYDPLPIKTILDIGAGAGTYGRIIRRIDKPLVVHAVEAYEPYLEKFGLANIYDKVFVEDVKTFADNMAHYDLVILGDVLEHLTRHQAYILWKKLKHFSRFIFLSLPVKPFREWFWGYNQPEEDYAENLLERHLHEWQYEEVIQMFGPFMWQVPYRTVAVFIAEGKWEG